MDSSFDLEKVDTPEKRQVFFGGLLSKGAGAIVDLISYYEVVRVELERAKFSPDDVNIEAARTVFKGLAQAVPTSDDPNCLDTIDELDALIRETNNIREVDFPRDSDDPLIAAFYQELGPHLLKPLPGDRADSWRGR